MNMKWMVVFCCLIIVILGGLLAGTVNLYRQDSEEYERLLAQAEITRERDVELMQDHLLKMTLLEIEHAEQGRRLKTKAEQFDLLMSERPEWNVTTREVITEYIEVPVKTRWFDSLEELETWRAAHNGTLWVKGKALVEQADCSSYAEWRMEQAEADGFRLPVAPVWAGRIYGENVSNQGDRHVGNWTWIGKNFYYVEAFPTDDPIDKINGTWRVIQ